MNRRIIYMILSLFLIAFIWYVSKIDNLYYKILCKINGGDSCFSNNLSDATCQDLLEPGHSIYGWCNDPTSRGAMLGNKRGPYLESCRDWVFDNLKCPPLNCKDLKFSRRAGENYGWCNDPSKLVAMRGDECGPYDDKCINWIYYPKDCPCRSESDGTTYRKARKCDIVCGPGKKDCTNLCKGLDSSLSSKAICGMVKGEYIPCQLSDCICKT